MPKKKLTKDALKAAKMIADKFGYASFTISTKNAKGKTYKQTGETNSKADSKRKALEPGKRKTAWGTFYIETRANRSDKKGSKK
jgi:hypothetical protein